MKEPTRMFCSSERVAGLAGRACVRQRPLVPFQKNFGSPLNFSRGGTRCGRAGSGAQAPKDAFGLLGFFPAFVGAALLQLEFRPSLQGPGLFAFGVDMPEEAQTLVEAGGWIVRRPGRSGQVGSGCTGRALQRGCRLAKSTP